MEKCVDSNYIQSENDATKTCKNRTCTENSFLSSNTKEQNECKACWKISSIRKKIASQERSSDPIENVTSQKRKRDLSGRQLNVLKKHVRESTRQSVQKKTKIIKRNVPDRLGKYVSYNVRSETKLLLTDWKLGARPQTDECSGEGHRPPSREHSEEILCAGHTDTKLAVLGKECLSNKEAVRLSNSFESDLETKNIFENFFDDCLGSTSNGRDVSSQENSNLDASSESEVGKSSQVERTPEKKKKQESLPPSAPVKIKDHGNYYTSHKNIRHVCAYCQKIFKSNGKLNSHVYSHTGERPFDCNHCGKAFSSKFKLVRHLLIHSEIRKFVCQICDRTFLRNDHLKNHYKVHDPQKKMYKCPKENCDKKYSSIMSHKKHMAYHSVEDGDLKCLICSVKYETKEEVLFHLKSHSGSRLFKSQSDKKFKCEFCERLFLTRKDVTRHLVVHTGERDFLCQFCPQRFGRKDHLVRHIKKSHGNEDLIRSEAETKPREEVKAMHSKEEVAVLSPHHLSTEENNTQTDESNKTHIVITVQGKSHKNTLPKRKRKLHDKKPFQKNESVVPKKKQVPLAKGKNSTTQILLQNIPNILIIPNNSIILLRNQSTSVKNSKGNEARANGDAEPAIPTAEPEPNEPLFSPSHTVQNSADFNFNYDPNVFPPPSQLLGGFSEPDNFCNFQMDLPPFGSHFEEPGHLNFEMLNHGDLLPRGEAEPPPSNACGNLLSEASRQVKLFEGGANVPEKAEREKNACEELFQDGHEALMLNESLLNEFKDESSPILPPDNDVGILSNILNQTNDNCGFELLRNLLTSENPVLSPLPGFSQIFHNSNANSS